MNQLLLLHGNPRRKKSKRTAAQRAATRRMIAAKRTKYRRNPVAAANPPARKRRRKSSKARVTRRTRKFGPRKFGFKINQITSLAQNAAIGAGGAIAVDVTMGYASGVLPAQLVSRVNTDGSTNWLYYATKGALAVGLGVFGGRIIGQSTAAKMGEGALTVMAYEIIRGLMPASIAMGRVGYYNAAPLANGMGRQLPNNMGRVLTMPNRAPVMARNR